MTKGKSENIKLIMPVIESSDHIQGSANVPVILVEYGDYECPYCALWETVIELGLGNKSAIGNILFLMIEGHCSYE